MVRAPSPLTTPTLPACDVRVYASDFLFSLIIIGYKLITLILDAVHLERSLEVKQRSIRLLS